ncbi:hypothetical protein VM1G_11787 [Cytospora mali]|uniref:Uncharacterized protein n=1 Tax=Cytospora mali TaxID=578113 RepID=A0A194W7C8_CYTMA|nr:hypothetical protein VM1G_11787 [Valsa mali]
MAGFSREERSLCWNVCIWADEGCEDSCVAGVYQRGDLLRVADMVHELGLCLTFEKPDDATPWQPALCPRSTGSCRLIVLDYDNKLPFPTPIPGEIRDYDYIFHSPHYSCIHHAKSPMRRDDPRATEINPPLQYRGLQVHRRLQVYRSYGLRRQSI